MTELRHKLRKALSAKQNVLPYWPALLGDGDGTIKVPDQPGYVYVRIGDEVHKIRNKRVAPRFDGMPVLIGSLPEEPEITQVVSVNQAMAEKLSNMMDYLSEHGETHRWFPGTASDPIWVEGYQIMPGRLGPASSSVSVTVYPFVIYVGRVGWLRIGPAFLDLSSYIPETEDKVAMVLVTIDTDGEFVMTKGSESNWEDFDALAATPAPPENTFLKLGAVRVYYGQKAIQMAKTNRDIMDLRFWQGTESAFTDLTDAFASYTGLGGKYVKVKADESGLETDIPAGGGDVIGPATSTDGHMAVWDGTDSKTLKDGGAVPTGSAGYDYILIRDEKTQNTPGGTFTRGDWRTRDLNTEVVDTGNHASLASNQITLAAGSYWAHILCPAQQVGGHQARLQNITAGATLLLGTSEVARAGTSFDWNDKSIIIGRFTLSSQSVIEVQHKSIGSYTSTGFGRPANISTEIYTVVELWQEP